MVVENDLFPCSLCTWTKTECFIMSHIDIFCCFLPIITSNNTRAGIIFTLWVYVCVIMAKDTFCRGNYHRSVFHYFGRSVSVFCYETLQVRSWDRNEGGVWRWVWSDPWVLSTHVLMYNDHRVLMGLNFNMLMGIADGMIPSRDAVQYVCVSTCVCGCACRCV